VIRDKRVQPGGERIPVKRGGVLEKRSYHASDDR
jgi:hypothetical protein